MKSREARKLLGGYAAGNLTEEERRQLFEAALEDQELFESLAAEEPLRDLLSDPATRARLVRELEPERRVPWFRRPLVWSLSGASAVLLVTVGVIFQRLETPDLKPALVAKVEQQRVPPVAESIDQGPPEAPPAKRAQVSPPRANRVAPPPAREPEAAAADRPAPFSESIEKARVQSPRQAAPQPEPKHDTAAKAEEVAVVPERAPAAPVAQPALVVPSNTPERPTEAVEGAGGTQPEKRERSVAAAGLRMQTDAASAMPGTNRTGFAPGLLRSTASRWWLQKRTKTGRWIAAAEGTPQPGDRVRVIFLPVADGELQVRERDTEGVWRPLLKPGFRVQAGRAYAIPPAGEFTLSTQGAKRLEIVLSPADGSAAITLAVSF